MVPFLRGAMRAIASLGCEVAMRNAAAGSICAGAQGGTEETLIDDFFTGDWCFWPALGQSAGEMKKKSPV
jgi:hypothetical protein